MDKNFMLIPHAMLNKLAIADIIKCNETTAPYGLVLSHSEALSLVETRTISLHKNGRIEFGGGIIDKLIKEFCDSPFLSQHNYAEMLHELIETFYFFKNETLDEMSDDELIPMMKKYFDENCQGCIELLQNRELETLARNIRYSKWDLSDLDENDDYIDEEDPDEQS